jgi:hypothetical protein
LTIYQECLQLRGGISKVGVIDGTDMLSSPGFEMPERSFGAGFIARGKLTFVEMGEIGSFSQNPQIMNPSDTKHKETQFQ